ncbi:MAG: diacylglycerol kinase [Xanthobacteraceae bacterium]|nr:diacylglycerol kinase [Xanthobacteraceae bacterium]
MKRIYNATLYSIRGIRYGVMHEAAVREEAMLLIAGLILGLFVAPSVGWYVIIVGSLLVLLAVEFLNTAIEKLADHVTPDHHTEIGRIKDYGSAAVFCGICLAGFTWLAALVVRLGLI